MGRLIFGMLMLPLLLVETSLLLNLLDLASEGITAWAIVNILSYPIILLGSIALHEGGHALVAHAVGLQVARVEIGIGRRIKRWHWRSVRLQLNTFPILGVTYAVPRHMRGLRWRYWLTTLGGPLVTVRRSHERGPADA